MGTRLLELSLQNARKRPEDVKKDKEAEALPPPRLRIVQTEAPTPPARREVRAAPAAEGSSRPRPDGLDLTDFEQLAPDRFRSPGGVAIKVARRGDGWTIEEIAWHGDARVDRSTAGQVRIEVGDLQLDYLGEIAARVRRK
jgi:hypothetical protein